MQKENKTIYAILGLLSHEPMSGYDIKGKIDRMLKYFWGASFGSIYPALGELEKNGMVTKQCLPNEKGREKFVYEITEAGKEQLKEWLQQPVEKDELRFETMLKLCFGNVGGTENSIKMVEAFQKKYEEELPVLQGFVHVLSEVLDQDETHQYYMLTAMYGIRLYEANIAWAKEAKKILQNKKES